VLHDSAGSLHWRTSAASNGELSALEKGGLVYVNQGGPIDLAMLEDSPDLFSPQQQYFDSSEFTDAANWKLIAETSMEGYHIKALHKQSF
jgi:phenylpropionate dioxygenase-like ring-hydroxylating dioxygenase large terminal subunit